MTGVQTCALPIWLDLVLHNGFSTEAGEQRGLALGRPETFDTFEELLDAYMRQLAFTYETLARRHKHEHQVYAENASFLFLSMLTDDCIDEGRCIFEGGTRYLGGIIETFGLTNLADSLVAIKKMVYDKKAFSLAELVEFLDADFEGYEAERRMLLACPKFGNDDPVADEMHTMLSDALCDLADQSRTQGDLHFFLNCNLNPDGIRYALNTKASADGRRYGDSFAVGNAPTAGRDTSGATALLNSISKADSVCAGYVQNLKLSRRMFHGQLYERTRALIDAYFDHGGSQLMITTLDRGVLERAMAEPEKHTHIMVRVGGWTARFVELPKPHQKEILQRTIYS